MGSYISSESKNAPKKKVNRDFENSLVFLESEFDFDQRVQNDIILTATRKSRVQDEIFYSDFSHMFGTRICEWEYFYPNEIHVYEVTKPNYVERILSLGEFVDKFLYKVIIDETLVEEPESRFSLLDY